MSTNKVNKTEKHNQSELESTRIYTNLRENINKLSREMDEQERSSRRPEIKRTAVKRESTKSNSTQANINGRIRVAGGSNVNARKRSTSSSSRIAGNSDILDGNLRNRAVKTEKRNPNRTGENRSSTNRINPNISSANNSNYNRKNISKCKKTPSQKILSFVGKTMAVISTTVLAILITLILMIMLICHGPSQKATELFTTTFLETGQMKFIVSMFLSDDKIKEIVANNSMSEMTAEVDTGLITVADTNENTDGKDIELVQISGNTYHAKMLIIKDPSRVKLATTYPWGEYGQELDQLVKKSGAMAGVNGGLYVSDSNKGGRPLGLVVCDGEIQFNNPSGYAGLHLIGFDKDNILRIISLEGMNATQIEKLVKDENIRDAVVFQEESSDKNNHFVKLVVNGEPRQMNGSGSGANPRTVIGQRKDGAVLLLVTDGRGAAGHLGATASDLIDIMMEYGAVNAANLDGGSSSSMYYNDKYEMTSVTLYYSNSSWKLPTAFVVK